MISVYPVQFPPSNTPITDASGNMSNSGMAFFRALYNRTGQGAGLVNQVATSSPTGSDLNSDWNIIVDGTGSPCTLPALTGGQMVMVQNNSSGNADIAPPGSGTIDGGTTPYVLATGKMQVFWFISSAVIISTQLG